MTVVHENLLCGPEFELINQIYPVSRETMNRLNILVDAVRAWQKKTNLVAHSTIGSIWARHVADSIQCAELMPDARCWVDVGSGGGFPGLVIAAVMAEHENAKVHLVESNHKKSAFLMQAARKMDVPVIVHADRIESAAKQFSNVDIVTARAFAPLKKLLELVEPIMTGRTVALFHKGRDYRPEIEECNGLWTFDLIDHKSSIAEDSVVLEISNLQKI